jgi:PKHD-type hydroxylase
MLTVIEGFLSRDDVTQIKNQLKVERWQEGRLTAGGLAGQRKNNQQMSDQSEISITLANTLLEKLGNHPKFVSAVIPHRIHPPRFNRYAVGETYGIHVDAPIMSMPHSNDVMRSDVSATLFFCDPGEYEGGELSIEGEFGCQEIKLNAGDMVIYPSSSLHQVKPVTSGERIAAILWVQSMVADAGKRALLYDLDQSIQGLTKARNTGAEELMRLSSVYQNLVRRWASF